jgi:AcrR family transcriptional regulator
MPGARAKPRRTQLERRAGTIRKLLDAVARTLIEVGYARTTVQEICARAGVSPGGLFRHFPTMEALLVAVAEDVGQKNLANYRRKLGRLREPSLVVVLRLVQDIVRSPINQAWFELAFAARTVPALHRALKPIAGRYSEDILALGREVLPELAATLGERFPLLVDTILAVFDGESVHRLVNKKPALEDARVELMAGLIASLVPRSSSGGSAGRGGGGPP